VIWWSAFAFSSGACWTLKFRILGLQCQKPWVVPGCFDQDKNDPEEKFSDSEPRRCLLLVSIAWLVPFPPVLFAANCVSRGLQCQALELSNVGKLKDSYNSYPPKTESSRWCLLFWGGEGVVCLQVPELPAVPKIVRLQDHLYKKGADTFLDWSATWRSVDRVANNPNHTKMKRR
jgi:hypothetical protein